MNITFDFDGTLTDERLRETCLSLIKEHNVSILTSRFSDNLKDVMDTAKAMGINTIYATDGKSKAKYIEENNLEIDMHYDDDYYEIQDIYDSSIKTLGILVDIYLDPRYQDELHCKMGF